MPKNDNHFPLVRQDPLFRRMEWIATLTLLLATAAVARPVTAATPLSITSPEGFSVSAEGLPSDAADAWRATVLIEGSTIIRSDGRDPILRTKRGSGVVMRLDNERRMVVVATNAHIITCQDAPCDLRIGFGDPFSAAGPAWTETLRIVSREPAKDLALLEVRVPDGAKPRVADFAATRCAGLEGGGLLSIGWPDLTVRKKWGVQPPPNRNDHVKRYSMGRLLVSLQGYRMRSQAVKLMERMQVLFHNADVLPGSSGGPVVNAEGAIVGINTMVVGNSKTPDHNHFCAREDPHKPGKACVHLAITSEEVAREYERVYASTIPLIKCSS